MKTIEIMGLGKTVQINMGEIKAYAVDGDIYEETAIADDGSLVAYEDATNAWVQLWPSRPEDY
jgi:hypothetical protein